MKTLLSIVCFLLVFSHLKSQPWLNLLPKEKAEIQTVNFYEIQKAFNQYWYGKDLKSKYITKGKGYKPFKRWEAFMVPRVYPNGEFPANKSWQEYQKERKKVKLKSTVVSNWNFVGPNITPLDKSANPSGLGRINCVAFHPSNSSILYAGSPSGGFWKSINSGISWITTTDELPSIGISDIAINPDNPDIIYIATGDGDASDTYSIGILKSVNGGISWTTTGLLWTTNNKVIIRRLLINPLHADTLLAASNTGIWRSSDGGNNWSNVQTGHFKDLEFHTANPEIVYAARYGTNNTRFYKSTNGGLTFTEINTGVDLTKTFRLELAVGGNTSANVVYALYSESSNDGFHSLWKSINAGDNWVKVYELAGGKNLLGWESNGTDVGGQGWFDLAMTVSPTNENEVYIGGVNVWKTIDSGLNWELVSHWQGDAAPYVHADHHGLNFSPSGVLFDANDGGLYKSTNGGQNWTDISKGLQILQIDRLGISQKTDNIVILGNQDNGTMKYNFSTNTWLQIYGGDGAECIVDEQDDNIIYVSSVYGDIQRSTNGGIDFEPIKPVEAKAGTWHTPFIMCPADNSTLYVGYNDIYKSIDRGSSWEKISTDLSVNKPLIQLAVAPSNTDFIYATSGDRLWKTNNGGLSWDEMVSDELSGLYITYFAIDDDQPEKIWLTVSGYEDGKKVFHSDDAGTTWSNYSENLPNVPVNCIIREKQSNDVLYLGTDIGVYYRDNSMISWQLFSEGLPNVEISELEIQYQSGLLRAATRGRGLWETPVRLKGSFDLLFSECFDVSSLPVGWAVETISDQGGTQAQIDFISNSLHPSGYSAKNCSHFVRFNSYSCEQGDKLRLKMTNPVSTLNDDSLRFTFYFLQDNQLNLKNDTIITQWSVDGSAWNNLDTITRYNIYSGWKKMVQNLPNETENRPNLYIGFLFISAQGNDLHLDDIKIEKVIPFSPLLSNAITNFDGGRIELGFNKKMNNPVGKQTEFLVKVTDEITGGVREIQPIAVFYKTGTFSSYILYLPLAISSGEIVTVSYTAGSVLSLDKGVLASFINHSVKNNVNVSVKEIDNINKIKVYPNPNSGCFDIEFFGVKSTAIAIKLLNLKGQSVYYLKMNNGLVDFKKTIELPFLSKGIYLLMIETDTEKYQKKLIIE